VFDNTRLGSNVVVAIFLLTTTFELPKKRGLNVGGGWNFAPTTIEI